MKTRLGFVSNSSSSSFIIGIALIEDENKFNKWWKPLNEKMKLHGDASITSVYDLQTANHPFICEGDLRVKDDLVEVSCFSGAYVSLSIKDKKPTDRVLIVSIANNEGDDSFPDKDGDYYSGPDWDIDLDFLGNNQVDLYHGITSKENGLVDGQVEFGAARNG